MQCISSLILLNIINALVWRQKVLSWPAKKTGAIHFSGKFSTRPNVERKLKLLVYRLWSYDLIGGVEMCIIIIFIIIVNIN